VALPKAEIITAADISFCTQASSSLPRTTRNYIPIIGTSRKGCKRQATDRPRVSCSFEHSNFIMPWPTFGSLAI